MHQILRNHSLAKRYTQNKITTIKVVPVYYIPKRNMMRATSYGVKMVSQTCLTPPMGLRLDRRYYPGERRVIRYRKDISDHDKKRLNLTDHEMNHDHVQNTKTGYVEALLTSSQNKNGSSPVSYDKVDPVKVNGDFTPQIDPKTKLPVLDQKGAQVPNPHKGGQYMSTYQQPRRLFEQAKGYYSTKEEAQPYMDKHETKIEMIIRKNHQKYKTQGEMQLPKQIGGQDDE